MNFRAAAVCVATLACASAAHARTRMYAVVVAQNRSLDPGVKPLQYADDDGVKNWELLSLYAERASLFVVLDEETARVHPNAAHEAEVPERQAILDRLSEYNALMAADLRRGDEPELFFVYAGHGDVDQSGQGYVNLNDGKLTRADLYREIIAPSKARFVHVIIDACKSYFMVNARGSHKWVDDRVDPSADRSDAQVKAFLAEEQLDRYPRAGVIVATSGDQETHEWSRYQGGILSHELRSALSGAADVNGDGRVEYSELRAFLAAANARVKNPEARVEVFSRPPAIDRHHPLVDLRQAQEGGRQARFLRFAPELAGRFHIEDDRGVRYADLNKETGAAFDVAIARGREYYVRRADPRDPDDERQAVTVRAQGPARVDVAQLAWRPRAIASRGALDQTFRQDLYRVPFGRGFYDGFVATTGDIPVEEGPAFVVREPRPAHDGNHRLSLGYVLSGPPPLSGDAGISHGVDARYGYKVGRFFELGAAAELAHGETSTQSVSRVSLLGDLALEFQPRDFLAVRLDAALGWQLYWGQLIVNGQALSGADGRSLRFELAPAIGLAVWRNLWLFARGGLAVDALFAGATSSSATGFFSFSAQIRL